MIIHLICILSYSVDKQMAENLAQDMGDLMHDFDVVLRYSNLTKYVDLN